MSAPMADCPTCGHNLSAFCGGCTAFVLDENGMPRTCGHDCSVDVFGESLWDTLRRSLASRSDDDDGPDTYAWDDGFEEVTP